MNTGAIILLVAVLLFCIIEVIGLVRSILAKRKKSPKVSSTEQAKDNSNKEV